MSGQIFFSRCNPALSVLVVLMFAACVAAEEPAVQFDVPALVGVHEVAFADGHELSSAQKIIDIVIPVTSEIQSSDRENIDEFRFDIYWNRNVYPLSDYAPKTQTVSEIEGLIAVEKSTDKNAGIGINLSSSYQDFVSGTAKADLSQRTGTKLRYQEVPQHEVLVASGTTKR